MIIRILASKSSEKALEYNNQKVAQGVASMIHEPYFNSFKLIRGLESNPFLDPRAKGLGLHLTFSPGDGETLNEDQAVSLAKDILEGLNLPKNPFLLFMHLDTGRKHYHVVTTRARKNGRTAKNGLIKKRCYNLGIQLEKKYNYKMGRSCSLRARVEFPINRFDKGLGDVQEQYRILHKKALEQKPLSFVEYQNSMRDMGVDVRQSTKTTRPRLIFTGLDENGMKCTTPAYDMDRKGDLFTEMTQSVASNINIMENKKTLSPSLQNRDISSAIDPHDMNVILSALEVSETFDDFMTCLGEYGMFIRIENGKASVINLRTGKEYSENQLEGCMTREELNLVRGDGWPDTELEEDESIVLNQGPRLHR